MSKVDGAILKVANRYLSLGYVVTLRSEFWPEFVEGLAIHLVVECPDDNAIVKVAAFASLPSQDELAAIAFSLAQQPGWRFELVLV